jgi:hypothetical protein
MLNFVFNRLLLDLSKNTTFFKLGDLKNDTEWLKINGTRGSKDSPGTQNGKFQEQGAK